MTYAFDRLYKNRATVPVTNNIITINFQGRVLTAAFVCSCNFESMGLPKNDLKPVKLNLDNISPGHRYLSSFCYLPIM